MVLPLLVTVAATFVRASSTGVGQAGFSITADCRDPRASILKSVFRIRHPSRSAPGVSVLLEVVDVNGSVLASLLREEITEARWRLSPRADGVSEVIVSAPVSPQGAGIVDSLERSATAFGLRASLIARPSADASTSKNSLTLHWGYPAGVERGQTMPVSTMAWNHGGKTRTIAIDTPRSPCDNGWPMLLRGNQGQWRALGAGDSATVSVDVLVPSSIPHGKPNESLISIRDGQSGESTAQHRWLFIFDTMPPVITSLRVLAFPKGAMAIQAIVADRHSGVGSSGTVASISTDGGRHWQLKVLRAIRDEFGRATIFEGVCDTLPRSEAVLLRIAVTDVAGSRTTALPSDVAAFVMPERARLLLEGEPLVERGYGSLAFDVESFASNPADSETGQVVSLPNSLADHKAALDYRAAAMRRWRSLIEAAEVKRVPPRHAVVTRRSRVVAGARDDEVSVTWP